MEKKFVIAFIVVCCLLKFVTAQDNTEREDIYLARVGQRIAELEMDDALSLWFTDADTGRPIQGALVAIENTGSTRTDDDGLAIFPVIKDGEHAFIFQKEGYVTTKDTFKVLLGSIFFNKYSIPQIKQIEHIKIILDWGSTPADLDVHLVKDNVYHISYRDTRTSLDKTAWLDKDTVNGYGPETITVTQVDRRAVYHCFIHNYSNRNEVNDSRMSRSKATVRVYINNRFHASYQIEPGKTGVTWYVFDIVNGEIKPINRFE
jgi:hypothetical protein